VREGIDYGPARAALGKLARWALDIAAHGVEDWPSARARVEKTRKAVMAQITGSAPGKASVEDVVFTAELLARIFDDELGLDLADAFEILDALDLPVDVLPLEDRRRRERASNDPAPAAMFVEARCATCPMSSAPAAPVAQVRPIVPRKPATPAVPPPLRFCDDCGYVHEPGDHVRYRNAA